MKQKLLSISLLAFLLSLLGSCTNQMWDNGGDEIVSLKPRQMVNLNVTLPKEAGVTRGGTVEKSNVSSLSLYCFDKFADGKWYLSQAADIPTEQANLTEEGNNYSLQFETAIGDKLFLVLGNMTPKVYIDSVATDVSPSVVADANHNIQGNYSKLTIEDFNNLVMTRSTAADLDSVKNCYSGCVLHNVSRAQESVNVLMRSCLASVKISFPQFNQLEQYGIKSHYRLGLVNTTDLIEVAGFDLTNMVYGNLGFKKKPTKELKSNFAYKYISNFKNILVFKEGGQSGIIYFAPNIINADNEHVLKADVTGLVFCVTLQCVNNLKCWVNSQWLNYSPMTSSTFWVLNYADDATINYMGIGFKPDPETKKILCFLNKASAEQYITEKGLTNVSPISIDSKLTPLIESSVSCYPIRLENKSATNLQDKYSVYANTQYLVNIANINTKGVSFSSAKSSISSAGYIGETMGFSFSVKTIAPTVVNGGDYNLE